MEIKRLKISDLSPDPANARKHSPKNIDAIKASLKRFGQQKPVVISKDNVVIAGNGTLEAAKALGWSEIDCTYSKLKGAEITAYGIADNRTGELASWEDEILGKHLQALREDDWDLKDLGFDLDEITNLIPNDAFNNESEEKDDLEKDKKYLLEIELPDEQAQKDCYEELCSQGLIVRFKNG